MKTTAREIAAIRPFQKQQLYKPGIVKSRTNQNSSFAAAIIRRYASGAASEFPTAFFVFFEPDTVENQEDSLLQPINYLITINKIEEKNDQFKLYQTWKQQLFTLVSAQLREAAGNHWGRYDTVKEIYHEMKRYNQAGRSDSVPSAAAATGRRTELTETLTVLREHSLSRSSHEPRRSAGLKDSLEDCFIPRRRIQNVTLAEQVLHSTRLPDYRRIWRLSVTQTHPAAADRLSGYLESLSKAERGSLLTLLNMEESTYRQELHAIKEIQWTQLQKQTAKSLEQLRKELTIAAGRSEHGLGKNESAAASTQNGVPSPGDSLQRVLPENGLERVLERNSKRASERTSERASERASEQTSELASELTSALTPKLSVQERLLQMVEGSVTAEELSAFWGFAAAAEKAGGAITEIGRSETVEAAEPEEIEENGTVLAGGRKTVERADLAQRIARLKSLEDWEKELYRSSLSESDAQELQRGEEALVYLQQDINQEKAEAISWIKERSQEQWPPLAGQLHRLESSVQFLRRRAALVQWTEKTREIEGVKLLRQLLLSGSESAEAGEKGTTSQGFYSEDESRLALIEKVQGMDRADWNKLAESIGALRQAGLPPENKGAGQKELAEWIQYMEPETWDRFVELILTVPEQRIQSENSIGSEAHADESFGENEGAPSYGEKTAALERFRSCLIEAGAADAESYGKQELTQRLQYKNALFNLVTERSRPEELRELTQAVRKSEKLGEAALEWLGDDSELARLPESGERKEEIRFVHALYHMVSENWEPTAGTTEVKTLAMAKAAAESAAADAAFIDKADAIFRDGADAVVGDKAAATERKLASLESAGRAMEDRELAQARQELVEWVQYMEPEQWDRFMDLVLVKAEGERELKTTETEAGDWNRAESKSSSLLQRMKGLLMQTGVENAAAYAGMETEKRLQYKTDFIKLVEKKASLRHLEELVKSVTEHEDLKEWAGQWLEPRKYKTPALREALELAGKRRSAVHQSSLEEGTETSWREPSWGSPELMLRPELLDQTKHWMPPQLERFAELILAERAETSNSIGAAMSTVAQTQRGLQPDAGEDGTALRLLQPDAGAAETKRRLLSSETDEAELSLMKSEPGGIGAALRLLQSEPGGAGAALGLMQPKAVGAGAEEAFIYRSAAMVVNRPQPTGKATLKPNPPQMADIEKKIEGQLQEELGDIRRVTTRKGLITASSEYEKQIRSLKEQVEQQRTEMETVRETQKKLIQLTDSNRLTENVLRQLGKQLKIEKLRRGL